MSKKSTQQEPLTTEEQMAFATMASLADIDIKKMCVKVAIGYAWIVCSYIAAEHAAVTLALLVSPLWMQLVILFFALAAACVGIVYTTPLVSNAVYDGAAYVFGKAKSFASGFKMPSIKMPFAKSEATVH